MAGLVDELLELVGMADLDVEIEDAESVARDDSADRRLQKRSLIDEFEKRKNFALKGATAKQLKEVLDLRIAFGTLASRNASEPEDLQKAYNAVLAKETEIRNEVRKTEAIRGRALQRLLAAVPESEKDRIADGALASEAQPLALQRATLVLALAEPTDGVPGKAMQDYRQPIEDSNEFIANVVMVREQISRRREARELLERELAEVGRHDVADPEAHVPGATARDVKTLLDGIADVARVIGDPASTLVQLNDQSARIGALRLEKANAADVVAARLVRRQDIDRASQDVKRGMPPESNPEPLAPYLHDIRQALDSKPLDDDHLLNAQAALDNLCSEAEIEADDARERAVRRTALGGRRREFQQLIDQSCEDFETGEVSKILQKFDEELDGTLHEIDFDQLEEDLNEAARVLDQVVEQVIGQGRASESEPPVDYLLRAAELAVAEGVRLLPFAAHTATELAQLPQQLALVKEHLGIGNDVPSDAPVASSSGKKGAKPPKNTASAPKVKPRPKQEALKKALSVVNDMREAIDTARAVAENQLRGNAAKRNALLGRIAATDPGGLPPGFDGILEAKRQVVRDLFGNPPQASIPDDVIKQAIKDANAFEACLAVARDIAVAWTAADKRFAAVRKDAREPSKVQLDGYREAVLRAGMLDAAKADFPAALLLCNRLQSGLLRVTSEAGQAAGAKQALGKVEVDGQPLDQDTVEAIYDLAGPEAAVLDAAGLKTLGSAFKKADTDGREALKALVSEGFGGEGKVLLGLVRGGDADAIVELAKGYAGPANQVHRKNLRGIVDQGGLGEQSHVLDDLLGFGVPDADDVDKAAKRRQNVDLLKSLGAAFGDEQGPARMKTLVADCGLGQPRADKPPRPGIMAELLQGGLGGDSAELRKFADGFAGAGATAEKDRARLKGLVDEGGFGGRPKAFAPLVQTLSSKHGGMAKAVTELKKVGQTFEGAQDRARLKTLLEGGGMSGDTRDPARRHEHPDTLAKVFVDGLEGRADKLKSFTDAFGDNAAHAEQARKMLEAWNEFPDVHQGKRQPGKMIGKLLEPHHLGGDVKKLQTRFTAKMDEFVDPEKRKLATRFGPHFDKKTPQNADKNAKPNPMPSGMTGIIMGYILQRHVPKFVNDGAKNDGSDWLAASNSFFPAETTADDLANIIGEAMAHPDAPKAGSNDNAKSVTLGNGMRVHIAVGDDGAVPHCYPESGTAPPDPNEIALFSKAETQRIFAAIKP